MIEGPIIQDQVVTHKRTGGHYIVLHGNNDGEKPIRTRAKIGNSEGPGEGWVDVVVYYDPLNANQMFVRDEVNFRNKFEVIE